MLITGDRLLQITLAIIGALLLFIMNDFHARIVKLQENLAIVQGNVEYIRGRVEGPLKPLQ